MTKHISTPNGPKADTQQERNTREWQHKLRTSPGHDEKRYTTSR